MGEMRAARIEADGQVQQRVRLRADGFRHLRQLDDVVLQVRVALQQRADVPP
jgi:hypothetical protein